MNSWTDFCATTAGDPTTSKRDYVQWQRGPLARTTMDMMKKGWATTSIGRGIWLVLVFHGIEGIGWEALTTETMRAYLDYIKEHEGHMWIAYFSRRSEVRPGARQQLGAN